MGMKLHIAINCLGMPFDGSTIPSGKSLGGSETAAYFMAKELRRLGNSVVVYTNSQTRGVWDGVLYEWAGQTSEQFPMGVNFHKAMMVPHDVCIIQRHPLAFARPINAKVTAWWLHDLAMIRQAPMVQQHLVNVDLTFTVSEWHKNQVAEIYGIPKDYVVATTNGVDYSLFEGLQENAREPRSLVYMARPERGLELLVGPDDCIMNQLKDCHLYVCGYDNTTAQMKDYYEWLWRRCDELPNVTNVGHLGKRQLYELLSKCMVYAYPTTFEDTSCIAALEANAAGLPLVGYKWSAVPETLTAGGAVLLDMMHDDKGQPYVDKAQYARAVLNLMNDPGKWRYLHQKALKKRQTWEAAAAQWDEVFQEKLAAKGSNHFRTMKHYERHSDIVALGDYAERNGLKVTDYLPDFEDNYRFFIEGTFKEHYQAYYEYEKNRGVNYGPESLDGSARYLFVAGYLEQLKPKRILDYGCAHGHYVMNLAKAMPETEFVGIDIEETNIEKARAWAKQDGVDNRCEFIAGTAEDLSGLGAGKFDLIMLGEVLEHVPDPAKVCEALHPVLTDDGMILVTVPYGPWEAIGYKEHKGWRAHLHHFERQDLAELFGEQRDYKLFAVPHSEKLGHYVLAYKPSGRPIGRVDYARKHRMQAPRQTVSACLIARDSELTIGKTLQSIDDIADELILGVDTETKDNTIEAASRFCRANGIKATIFEIESPIVQGFDNARNQTVERAAMDWILWIDSDETIDNQQAIKKYTRDNCFLGYGVKQHHFATEPPSCFKTDLPVRLFRNHVGARFYGHVHEHPEIELNKGMEKVHIIEDVSIIHTGYTTEAIRRKRFARNYPLMIRDRQRHPTRKLGRFLWLRDQSHSINFGLEANGGRVTPEMQAMALEMVGIWRELLAEGETRLALEGLAFYSTAARVLTAKPIHYVCKLDVALGTNGCNPENLPIDAIFVNREDIDRLMAHITEIKTKQFESRYY